MNIRKLTLLFIMSIMSLPANASGQNKKDVRYIKLLKSQGFGSALTRYVTFTKIYSGDGFLILLYENQNPETMHGNTELVVLKSSTFLYEYGANGDENCLVHGPYIYCDGLIGNNGRPSYISKVKISDL